MAGVMRSNRRASAAGKGDGRQVPGSEAGLDGLLARRGAGPTARRGSGPRVEHAAGPTAGPAAAPGVGRSAGSTPAHVADASGAGAGMVRVSVDGDPALVVDLSLDADRSALPVGAVRRLPANHGQAVGTMEVEVVVDGWRFEVTLEPARRAALRERVQRNDAGGGGGRQVVRAPLPGRIVRVWVTAGDAVEPGARLCSLEAMKMENEVVAHRAGTIEQVRVEPGARVERGDELVVIG